MKSRTGYKVMNPDFTCRGFKFEVGQTYTHEGGFGLCESGFHFCKEANSCFNYYGFNPDNVVCEVKAVGKCIDGDDKSVTDKIKIIRQLTWEEVLRIVNVGKGNTGRLNSGDWNSGDRNSGDRNSGDSNSGDWNSARFSSGVFNTEEQPILIFNKPSDWTYTQWRNSEACAILSGLILTKWICFSEMTDEEKKVDANAFVRDGYLKRYDYKEACQTLWNKLNTSQRNAIKQLPNFDGGVFWTITGVDINL